MKNVSGVKERLITFINSKNLSQSAFERTCNLGSGLVNNIKGSISKNTLDKISVIFPDLNREWLILGEGQMLIDANKKEEQKLKVNAIPVVPTREIQDYILSGGILEYPGLDYYILPLFSQMGADFLTFVKGNELPYFNGVRFVVLKIAPIGRFYQWGRVYLLCTEQGVLFKRLLKSESPDEILCGSDDEYPPFVLPVSEILAMAFVLAVVKIE